MIPQPLPPALTAVLVEARTIQGYDINNLRTMADRDPAGFRALAYRNEPRLRAALAEFDALPENTPNRAHIAGALSLVCLWSALDSFDRERHRRAAALGRIAAADPGLPADFRLYLAMLRTQEVIAEIGEGIVPPDVWAVLAEIEGYRELVHVMPLEARGDASDIFDVGINVLTMVASAMENNPGFHAANGPRLVEMGDRTAEDSNARIHRTVMQRIHTVTISIQHGDGESAQVAIDEVRSLLEQLPTADPFRSNYEATLPVLDLYASIATYATENADSVAEMTPRLEQDLARLSQNPELTDGQRALHLSMLAGIRLRELTPESMDEAVEVSARALSMSPPEDAEHARLLATAGNARIARWRKFGDPEDRGELRAGIELLVQGWDHATKANHYESLSTLAVPLAQAYHLDGRRILAHETATAGLRGRLWTTLLQSRAADAHASARHAAREAYAVATMFLRDNETEHAAWALEMGRGLIIHSATQRRDAAARLEDLGEQELAREWRAATAAGAAAGPTSMLRRRVMCAISGVELSPDGSLAEQFAAATALMPDPPSADEIRAALKTLDADALVYLVPGQGAGNGMAITIPVAEHARWISLPDLNSEHLAEFGWLPQAGARDLGPIPDTHASRNELEDVCDWAWNVAIGPLLTEIEPPADRPPRIVLIPGRELARVPWHAARHRIEGRLRYAVEDVEFSYTPSARAFCASAWSRDVPIDGPGLIVSDPDTADQGLPLAGAREEAAAIRSCFYPEAQLLGRVPDGSSAPDGRGSPDEVTAWLTTAPTGAMLHLACHATVPKAAGNQDTAFLLLADGQRLSAETLLDSLDASRSGELSLVVLAACSSGKSGRGYDEAFSLATAFLTRGARSVISTAWSVADTATSVLMFMFHHLLREAGLRPSEALRAAQLWMLQGGELPTSAPPSLRAADLERTSSDLAVWAAFIYFGR